MNIKKPKVSVVMPVFNAEKWLPEAIESILKQTFTDFEFIIVNDMSSDRSSDIVRAYQENDPRIILINNEKNLGVARTLNKGVAHATGQYIARMDADDISEPERFAQQVNFLDHHPECIVLGTAIKRLRRDGSIKERFYPEDNHSLKLMLMFECCFSHPTVMIRSDILNPDNFLYDNTFTNAQDYELWSRLKNAGGFHNLPIPLLKYRELDSSVSMQARKNNAKRQRVDKIYAALMQEAGFTEADLSLHKQIIHKEHRATLKPSDVDKHLSKIFQCFPDAKNTQEIRQQVFKSLRKNSVFFLRNIWFQYFTKKA